MIYMAETKNSIVKRFKMILAEYEASPEFQLEKNQIKESIKRKARETLESEIAEAAKRIRAEREEEEEVQVIEEPSSDDDSSTQNWEFVFLEKDEQK